MASRPRIRIGHTNTDKIFEILGWFLVAALWCLTLANYSELPTSIPVHFNLAGQVDRYGSKTAVFLLPVIGTLLFAGMTILNRFPHLFNYPTQVIQENATRLYTSATRMIRYLKLAIVVLFLYFLLKTLHTVQGKQVGLGIWFLPLISVFFIVFLAFFIIRMAKGKKGN